MLQDVEARRLTEVDFLNGGISRFGRELDDRVLIDDFDAEAICRCRACGYTRKVDIFKPVIAAVNGHAFAAGLETALLADIRIAAENADFGALERRWNIVGGDGMTVRLPLVVGFAKAMELIITGRAVDADEALRIGLVNEVVGPGEHLERALELAERISSFPQETMLADRRAAIEGLGLMLADGLALEAQAGPEVFADAVAGAARFAGGEGRGGAGAGV